MGKTSKDEICVNCGHGCVWRLYRGRYSWVHVNEKHDAKNDIYKCSEDPDCKCIDPEPKRYK